jgi:hypothetical protein
MDKLEQYLDQVCRRIGGPKALRLHIRQELGEHLRDAVAQHRAAGLAQEAALAKALEEFGNPAEVRSELEATHGQRLLAVAIDKAIEWKEMTMKSKWLWLTWAHLALVSVIVVEVLWILFLTMMIVPRFQVLTRDGIIDPATLEYQALSWMPGFLERLRPSLGNLSILYIVIPLLLWILFEWRVRSENKTFMRLSALGTVAGGLAVVAILAAGSLVISFALGVPAVGRLARPYALDRIAQIDTSIGALEQAIAKNDWETMQNQADRASQALDELAHAAPAAHALAPPNEPGTVKALQMQLNIANERLRGASESIREKNLEKLETALNEFRPSYRVVREAAKKNLE